VAVDAMVRAGLASWDGDDLILDGYDLWGEVRTKRIRHSDDDAGRDAGRDAGENAGRNSGEDAAQGRGDGTEGYERTGSGSECTATGSAPPPDDDGAPNCAGDVVERDEEESLAPVASTGSRLARGLR